MLTLNSKISKDDGITMEILWDNKIISVLMVLSSNKDDIRRNLKDLANDLLRIENTIDSMLDIETKEARKNLLDIVDKKRGY